MQVLRNEVHQPYSRTPSLGDDGSYETGVDSIVSAQAQVFVCEALLALLVLAEHLLWQTTVRMRQALIAS